MKGIDSKYLAKGAIMLTLGYLALWFIGPALLAEAEAIIGLPLWFWWSCIVAPLLLCVAAAVWLRADD
ncbi:YhdT family protein [Ferrimonas lipolytica]|uniref:YhdT family protein n=2 Tax=Ferrimonas lipolytica TaxID=2724191 RepID=A0A6H1UBA0_9GAMM|nr:DUF997 family protein [Ferrimonas lipolytica]QIZ75860.1 YhdT family protein [Ferrimonas lipolytica]